MCLIQIRRPLRGVGFHALNHLRGRLLQLGSAGQAVGADPGDLDRSRTLRERREESSLRDRSSNRGGALVDAQ